MAQSKLLGAFLICAIVGGGILSVGAVELSTINDCNNQQKTCTIGAKYNNQSITNNTSIFTERIKIETQLKDFINEKNGNITFSANSAFFVLWDDNSGITTLTNYGTIGGHFEIFKGKGVDIINNYGTMGGLQIGIGTTTINNLGFINKITNIMGLHISIGNNDITSKVLLQNYKIKIDESASNFNSFIKAENNTSDASINSHLTIEITGNSASIAFKDGNSKMILGFGNAFQFGEAYLIEKLVIDKDGGKVTGLDVDFSRLALGDEYKDLYTLVKSGDNAFIVNLIGGGGGGGDTNPNKPAITIHTPITELYKANVRTMNNFLTMSNSMIYSRKYNFVILRERSDRRISNIESNEIFFYRNESINRRIKRQNKRNYSRESLKAQNLKQPQNLTIDSANRTRESQNQAQNLTSHNYYFILTPFINHNLFFESGRYNLSGFDYGFLTAFSTKVAESNSLGAHFMMSYGSLGDKKDKDLSIKSLNLNLGLNYKLDLIWDMYLKARGDFFYFLNQAKTLTMFEAIKPNNMGFGASVSYGKDFDFGKGGVLGIEAGIDYKALKTNEVSLNSQTYKQSLYNLIYADVGMNYNKYFGGFGLNLGGGFKANLAPKITESALIINTQTLKFTLDNDKYLGYANAGISYLLNAKSFDMEFSLAYYGNYGDRGMSNGGGMEWRVVW